MPVLPQFEVVASTQAARTVFLSGDSSALLFSALAAINDFHQWYKDGGLTAADYDFIQTLIDKANYQLMTPNIGQIIMYTTADTPIFCLPCDGEEYAREDYPLLYAVLDAAYIVDSDTFVTPNLASRSPIGTGEGTGLSAVSVNEIKGEEFHELTESENAVHSHNDSGHAHTYQPPGATGLFVSPGEVPALLPALLPSSTTTGFAAIQSSGEGEPHNTIHPVVGVKFGVIFQ